MKKTLLSLLLCAALLFGLPGCSARSGALYGDGVPESTQGKDVTRAKAADNVFSLNYNEDYSLNPILATNHSNQLVCDLVYENMVELDNNFNVVPNVLDEGTPNDTATYWIFTINPGHVFHDGSPVTGNDIRYSLEDGTEFAAACDTWNPSGESVFWVLVPALAPGMTVTSPVITAVSAIYAPLAISGSFPAADLIIRYVLRISVF